MRNHHRNGHDSLDTKGNRLFATQQVLVTVLRVVRLSGIRASFFMTLPARRSCRQDWQPYGRTRSRVMITRVGMGLRGLMSVGLLLWERPEQVRGILRRRAVAG